MDLNNKVIKVLSDEHGAKVIQFFKSKGIDTKDYIKLATRKNKLGYFFYLNCYGIINGKFGVWSTGQVEDAKAEIIELPTELPQRGDKILVWDNNRDQPSVRIFLTYIEGAVLPVQCVNHSGNDEIKFANNERFNITKWKYWKPIPKEKIV